ncbi:MAG: C39 family peptidase [Anaerolineales bacterium]
MSRKVYLLGAVVLALLLTPWVYGLPFVQESVAWRVSELRAQIKYALSPPEEAVFIPQSTLSAMVDATLAAIMTPTPNAPPTEVPVEPTEPGPTLTSSPMPSPIPDHVFLPGIQHEYQKWNNCGPTNLAMALSYWGWEGDQRPVANFTKPNPRDKNVMPYELAEYVSKETGFNVISRAGGDQDLLKRLIAAGFPVIVEKGLEGPGFDGWMGHYQVLAGYDDVLRRYDAYDSYQGDFSHGNTLPVSYKAVEEYWRHFNHQYLVIYPAEREAELLAILGSDANEEVNWRNSAQQASDDIFSTTGRDQFFAWFNRGTNLMQLQDYGGAAAAYDEAFNIYAGLDPDMRPWRMLWYQTGPYWAYYYSGRYWDVLNLTTQTLYNMSEPVLEESYYWRGLAKEALGDVAGAIEDFQTSAEVHPGFLPALTQLDRLGVSP